MANVQLQITSRVSIQLYEDKAIMLRVIGWNENYLTGVPRSKNPVPGTGGSEASLGGDEVPASQNFHCGRHRAFRQACCFGYVAQARAHEPPARARRGAIKMEVNQERTRSFVMADEVTQQYIQHVNIYGHEASLTRHRAKVGLSF